MMFDLHHLRDGIRQIYEFWMGVTPHQNHVNPIGAAGDPFDHLIHIQKPISNDIIYLIQHDQIIFPAGEFLGGETPSLFRCQPCFEGRWNYK